MKRFISMISALVLVFSLAPPVMAEQENACALTFGAFEGINTIWAEYATTAQDGELEVTFRDSKWYAAANNKGGTLRVAVVSTEPLDLSQPIAWVTEKNSDVAPALTLTALKFNEEPAPIRFSAELRTAELVGDSLTVSVEINTPIPMRCYMAVAAYCNGRMVRINLREVEMKKTESSVQTVMDGCAETEEVKVFFLSEDYEPLGTAQRAEL